MRKWYACASLLVLGGSALAASDLLLFLRTELEVQRLGDAHRRLLLQIENIFQVAFERL